MFVTFVQEITTFDVHVFYKIIMRKMYHSSRLLRHPTRFRKLGYVLLDDVTQVELPILPLLHINIRENILTFTVSKEGGFTVLTLFREKQEEGNE